eukprot:TRINITY_DN1206_c1_g1_i1.p1 TRINITY_DN1206_c1_g1~~TRINITY_DN1206_c1_g1_i1.p1  ORF type:complete len:116 (+),score=14.61 TRINITY_DN1206_c1_g1_i1:21-368(+)
MPKQMPENMRLPRPRTRAGRASFVDCRTVGANVSRRQNTISGDRAGAPQGAQRTEKKESGGATRVFGRRVDPLARPVGGKQRMKEKGIKVKKKKKQKSTQSKQDKNNKENNKREN